MLFGRIRVGRSVMSRSSKRMPPGLGGVRPVMARSNVVLPQPEEPSSAMSSPERTSRLTSSSATSSPRRFETRSMLS